MPLELDANASFGLLDEIRAAMGTLPSIFHNPSSVHSGGQKARALVEDVRRHLLEFVGLSQGYDLIFTSGATEANNQAVHVDVLQSQGDCSLVGNVTEHPSVLEPLKHFTQHGGCLELVKLQPGQWRPDAALYLEKVSSTTTFATCMSANNETGVCYPVAEIFGALRAASEKISLHVDAVQSLGKTNEDFAAMDADLYTFSGHKIGALSGVGALIFRKEMDIIPLLRGGPQEQRRRAGTENVIGIWSWGLALHFWQREGARIRSAMADNRNYLQRCLTEAIENIRCNGDGQSRLPNTLSVTIPGVRADDVLVGLDVQGISAASGAACSSGKPEPSHVLLALGFSVAEARASFRFSLRGTESRSEIERAVEILKDIVRRQREAVV